MSWTGKHHEFVVEDFYKNRESYTATIQNSKNYYKLSR